MANLKSEVKSWLETVFKEEDISDYILEIEGNSEKGDGFTGEILFVNLCKRGTTPKELHLALKCSNRNKTLRTKMPMNDIFKHETYIYNVVNTAFTKFQQEKGITEMFNSMPKFYGTFIGENIEVLVFENLKKGGYELWDKRKPVTTKHLEMVLEEYGKWHALSVALRDQKPEEFKQLTDGLKNMWYQFCKATDMTVVFERTVEEALELLKNELNETTMKEWLEFLSHLPKYLLEMPVNPHYFSVIAHGDCWNNNFMYKIEGDVCKPLRVAILDWQISSLSSPAIDLSIYLYCCGSQNDLENLDGLLEKYYLSFSTFAKKLGTDVSKLYPLSQLLADWEHVAKFGIAFGMTASKLCLLNKDKTPDITKTVEQGGGFSDAFVMELNDSSAYKDRVRYLIEHAVKRRITKPNSFFSNLDVDK